MTSLASVVGGRASLRHFARIVSGSGFPVDMQGQSGLELPFFKVRDLRSADKSGVLGTPSDSITRETARGLGATVIPKGALAFAKVGAALLLGRVGALPTDGCIDNNMSALIFEPSFDLSFARYLMLTFDFRRFVLPGPVPSLDIDGLREFQVPVFSLEEQRAIADYLDQETAQIDALVAKQEEFIGLLWERRMRLIDLHALGGFNPLVPSERFAAIPIGAAFDVRLGKMLDAGKVLRNDDRDLPYVRAANLQDAGLDLESVKTMPYSPREAKLLDLQAGDLLVVEGGAVGTNVLLDQGMPGWSFQKTVNRVRSISTASTAWLGFVLRSYRDAGVFDIVCNGSTIPHLTAEKLRSLRVPNFEPSRQAAIVNLLNDQTSRIDNLIAKAEEHIALAKERRAALITAAVTGQFDVRTARKAG